MSWTTTGLESAITRTNATIDQEVMNVLSASTYTDQSSPRSNVARNKRTPLGFLVDNSNDDEDESARPRKRTKTTKTASNRTKTNSEDTNKKHRGRPRIDGQDETAVDRRRTQIRLAQRAYRNRKETTISTLKQQNVELQQTIARMADAYKTLQEDLTRSQALRHQAHALNLLESMRKELDHAVTLSLVDDQADDDGTTASAPTKAKTDQGSRIVTESVPSTTDLSHLEDKQNSYDFRSETHALQRHPSKTADITDIDVDGFDLGSSIHQSSYFDWMPDIMQPGTLTELDQTDFLSGSWPGDNLSLERSFPQRKAYTYSFQETSFARRLHRLSLEKAFRSLTNHNIDPAMLARTFRFTLFYVNKKRLRNGLQEILQKKAGEPLENWEVPFFHVGGAGTHFPKRDAFGTPVFPPNLQSPAKAPGPWRLVDEESGPVDDSAIQLMLDEMGYGGEWYDSHDVQEYLKSKGIYLDGTSSFVEVDTAMIALPELQVRSSTTTSSTVPTLAGSPASSHSFLTTTSAVKMGGTGINSVAAGLNDQLSILGPANAEYLSSYQWSSAPGIVGPNSPGTIPTFEQVVQRKQGIVTLDVERFLERVVNGGSCLGRAPGYRKEAVDSALALAVQEAF